LYKEVKYLYFTEEVPIKTIANRLDLSYYKLRKAIKSHEVNPDMIFDRQKKPTTFKKLHDRAKRHINNLLVDS